MDLARFLQLGDLTQNPTLREGDIVRVPVIDETVSVTGSVAFPTAYAFRPGETVADILQLATAGAPYRAGAADTVRLMRSIDRQGDTVIPLSRDDAMGVLGKSLPLRPFDALFLPRVSHFNTVPTAIIEGEVVMPGTYPISPDVTTVRDLIEMAGGFTAEGSLSEATLRRLPVVSPRDSIAPLESLPRELLSPEDLRVLQVTSRADERSVVVDFGRLLEGSVDAFNITLEAGDRLYVPEQRFEVSVLGAVIQPGIVPFTEGQDLDYYISTAGGYSQDADRGDVMVLKNRTGSRLRSGEVMALEPGDRIIVPFRNHLTLLERMESVQTVFGAIAGFVLTFVGIQQLFNR